MPPRKSNPYVTPEAEALLAEAQPPEVPAAEAEPAVVGEDEIVFPEVYANPKVINEQFYVIGSPYRRRFVNGRFVANNMTERTAVRACLAAWGRDKPDRWKGEDRKIEFVDKKTGFRTFLDNAKYDFEFYHD